MLSLTSLFNDYTLSLDGIPVNYMIFYNWFKVELPGKIGYPINNSATIQPTLHTSVGFPYCLLLSNIYGDRYHLVATYYERMFS